MFETAPHLAGLDELVDAGLPDVSSLTINVQLSDAPFVNGMQDFYFTNPGARASKIMAECSIQAQARNTEGTGTDDNASLSFSGLCDAFYAYNSA